MSGFLHSLKNITGKHGQDTRMRYSVAPLPGDSGFRQWHDAMMMCARLPGGIPQEFRRRLWLTLAEKNLQARGVDWSHAERFCFNEWSNPDDDELGDQIVKDLHRTGCSLFCGEDAEDNQAMLKRVLLAYARWNKAVGYCQGFNMLAAIILEVMEREESDALKVMIYLIEGVLPESYFANNLRGLSVDMAVFRDLLRLRLPHLSRHLEHLQHDAADLATGTIYEPPLTNVFTMQWFLTLFSNCLPRETVMRVWDLTFLQGNEVLLRTALAIWDGLAGRILEVHSADEFYTVMGVLTREMLTFGLMDANKLVQTVVGMAPFPFPGLAELRDKYIYNITPWTQVSSVARRGLRLFYSDDDDNEDNEDDDQTIAVATAFGLSGIFRKGLDSSRGPSPVCGGSALPPGSFSPPITFPTPRHSHEISRPNLDISALKKQYARLRERQKQAHIILTASQLRAGGGSGAGPQGHGAGQQRSTPLTMNHLLRGKKALTSKTRRVVPQGVIPTMKPKKKAERKLSEPLGTRSAYQPQALRQPTKPEAPRATPQGTLGPTPCTPGTPKGVETLHWKDTPRRDRRLSLPSGVKLLEAGPTAIPVLEVQDEADDDDGGSSTSTELCDDDEEDKLSDLEADVTAGTSTNAAKKRKAAMAEVANVIVTPKQTAKGEKIGKPKEIEQAGKEERKVHLDNKSKPDSKTVGEKLEAVSVKPKLKEKLTKTNAEVNIGSSTIPGERKLDTECEIKPEMRVEATKADVSDNLTPKQTAEGGENEKSKDKEQAGKEESKVHLDNKSNPDSKTVGEKLEAVSVKPNVKEKLMEADVEVNTCTVLGETKLDTVCEIKPELRVEGDEANVLDMKEETKLGPLPSETKLEVETVSAVSEINVDSEVNELNRPSDVEATINELNSEVEATINELNSEVEATINELDNEVEAKINELDNEVEATINVKKQKTLTDTKMPIGKPNVKVDDGASETGFKMEVDTAAPDTKPETNFENDLEMSKSEIISKTILDPIVMKTELEIVMNTKTSQDDVVYNGLDNKDYEMRLKTAMPDNKLDTVTKATDTIAEINNDTIPESKFSNERNVPVYEVNPGEIDDIISEIIQKVKQGTEARLYSVDNLETKAEISEVSESGVPAEGNLGAEGNYEPKVEDLTFDTKLPDIPVTDIPSLLIGEPPSLLSKEDPIVSLLTKQNEIPKVCDENQVDQTYKPLDTQTSFSYSYGIPIEDLLAGKNLTAAEIIARIPFPSDVSFMKGPEEIDKFSAQHNVTPERSPSETNLPDFPIIVPVSETSLIVKSPVTSPSRSSSMSHSPSPRGSPTATSPHRSPDRSPSASPTQMREKRLKKWCLSDLPSTPLSDANSPIVPPKSPKITVEDEKRNIFEIHSGRPTLTDKGEAQLMKDVKVSAEENSTQLKSKLFDLDLLHQEVSKTVDQSLPKEDVGGQSVTYPTSRFASLLEKKDNADILVDEATDSSVAHVDETASEVKSEQQGQQNKSSAVDINLLFKSNLESLEYNNALTNKSLSANVNGNEVDEVRRKDSIDLTVEVKTSPTVSIIDSFTSSTVSSSGIPNTAVSSVTDSVSSGKKPEAAVSEPNRSHERESQVADAKETLPAQDGKADSRVPSFVMPDAIEAEDADLIASSTEATALTSSTNAAGGDASTGAHKTETDTSKIALDERIYALLPSGTIASWSTKYEQEIVTESNTDSSLNKHDKVNDAQVNQEDIAQAKQIKEDISEKANICEDTDLSSEIEGIEKSISTYGRIEKGDPTSRELDEERELLQELEETLGVKYQELQVSSIPPFKKYSNDSDQKLDTKSPKSKDNMPQESNQKSSVAVVSDKVSALPKKSEQAEKPKEASSFSHYPTQDDKSLLDVTGAEAMSLADELLTSLMATGECDTSAEVPGGGFSPLSRHRGESSLTASIEGRISVLTCDPDESIISFEEVEEDDTVFEGSIESETDYFNDKDLSSEAIRQRLWKGVKSLSLDADVTLDPDIFCFLIQQSSRRKETKDGKKKGLQKRRNSEVELQALVKENTEIIKRIMKQKSIDETGTAIYSIKETETPSNTPTDEPLSKVPTLENRSYTDPALSSIPLLESKDSRPINNTDPESNKSLDTKNIKGSRKMEVLTILTDTWVPPSAEDSSPFSSPISPKSFTQAISKSPALSPSLERKHSLQGHQGDSALKSPTASKSPYKSSKLSRSSSSATLEGSIRPITFNPFPTRNIQRQPKDVAVKLGLYSPTKTPGTSPT